MIHWATMLFTVVVLLVLLALAGLDRDVLAPLAVGALLAVVFGILALVRARREPG